MSRVYEALCVSQRERGLAAGLFTPDTFAPELAPAEPTVSLSWEEIPSFSPLACPESRLVALTGGSNLGAEKFRLLRARLRHLQDQQHVHRLVVTSAVPEEGKTLTAMNLAISLAKHTSQKILLLEGDLHKPALARQMGLERSRGLSEWFGATEPIHRFLYQVDDLQLWILPAGIPDGHPLAILQSAKFLELFQLLSNKFDWIVIDAPPLLPLADVNFWAKQTDGLLLVVRQGKAPRKLLKKGLETLDNARILGVVLNDIQATERNYYDRYYAPKGPGAKGHD
jgi:capsular exopolysaccharide synthesis family protein